MIDSKSMYGPRTPIVCWRCAMRLATCSILDYAYLAYDEVLYRNMCSLCRDYEISKVYSGLADLSRRKSIANIRVIKEL